ncbi:uncharacterized protein B0H18DRAFT_1134039 [Fomitopsis serialis]|uniref:uncharacterized protein n=1 Tax=Fomitopsis serialis TaxID=139415 RepID=UPI002007AE17|nr:uncharacterized protein B0H18DRAFT_1134039 [Neoantrodia serialis]KAH9938477.1 hypothetical protein B0H18DRAFT_1134039 [Neoantrodia serialis]
MSYTTVPFPGASSPLMQPGTPFQVPGSPQPAATIQPGSITYTTTVGANGQVVYHPFNYQTPQGVVSGIQWVPAEATQVVPTGAVPANAEFMASFNRGQIQPDGGAMRDWQREEERRRKKEDRRERERGREDRDLRRAREKDGRVERERSRSRRPSLNGGYGGAYPAPAYGATADLERRFQDLELDRAREREREYEGDRRNGVGTRSRRGSFYGGDRPPSGYQAAPGGPAYPSPPGAYPSPAPAGYGGSPAATYGQPGYAAQYGRSSTYPPPSPRPGEAIPIARPVSPYQAGPLPRPVSPYLPGAIPRPVSPYQNPMARPVSPYQNPMPMARPVSPYQPGMQRTASPRPGMDVYPRGHVMEGQPMRRGGSRAPSPAPGYGAAPPTSSYPGMNTSAYSTPGYGAQPGGYGSQPGGYGGPASPRMPLMPGEQAQQMLSAPEGFSRPPNLAQPYTHFEMMKIQEMDDFWRGTLTADLIDLWNASFFGRRGVEVVLYKGRERRSGRGVGTVDLHLPGFDTYDPDSDELDSSDDDDDDSSEDDRDDRYRYGNAYGGVYGRQTLRRERKAEKKMRKREKKRRAKLRELERKYSLYLTCTSPREGGLGPQM